MNHYRNTVMENNNNDKNLQSRVYSLENRLNIVEKQYYLSGNTIVSSVSILCATFFTLSIIKCLFCK